MAANEERRGCVLLLKAQHEDGDRFVEALEAAGYNAVLVPVLSFIFTNQDQLSEALSQSERFAGIVLTSPRSLQAVTQALALLDDEIQVEVPSTLRCFVVGQATGEAAKRAGFHPEGGDSGNAERLSGFILNSVSKEEMRPLLYPSGVLRRDTLVERMQENGHPLEEIIAYETVPIKSIEEDVSKAFTNINPPDRVVFFSPSGVEFTRTAVDQEVLPIMSLKVYAIGPTTREAIVSAGYPLSGTAAKPDPMSLITLLKEEDQSTR